ncbi:MAG: hypothetical protein Q9208_003537 [Pyrenodesmia sp. 3 TL-2023]
MARSNHTSSELPNYELIQRSQTESRLLPAPSPAPSTIEDDMVKPTSRLPPKPLPGRRKYRPFIVVTLVTIITIVSLSALIASIRHTMPEAVKTSYLYSLQSDGEPSCDLINPQNSSRLQSAFQINLRGAAQLSFGQAKLVDLLFDLFVGQGGRLVLAAVSYVVFMDALLRSMEITPVSYKLYASLVFSTNSLTATWHSIKAVSTTKGWRAKAYLVWCAIAMIYVLAFPTLIESATGYVNPSSTGFNMANGTMVMADSDKLTSCLNVTGGLLLGLSENNTVMDGPPAHVFDVYRHYRSSSYFSQIPSAVNKSSGLYELYTASSRKVYDYPNSTTEYYPYSTLSAYEIHSYFNYTTNVTINGKMHILNNTSPSDLYRASYCYDGDLVDPYKLTTNTYCFAKSFFVWGFSSIVLYVILSLQILWTIGMYAVWMDANINSELVKYGRKIRGPFRAAADLVEAMNETLGYEYCAYKDKEIAKALEGSGDRLRYYSSLTDDDKVLHIGMTSEPSAYVYLSRKRLYGSRGTKGEKEGE